MSWISITSRSWLAANYFKHWFCFYASSICLEAFVYIFWFGIPATSYTCQLSEPFRGLLCCLHFSQVHHQLTTDNLCKASVNLSVFAVLQPSFTTLLYKGMKITFANIVYFSVNRLVTFLFILSFFPSVSTSIHYRNISVGQVKFQMCCQHFQAVTTVFPSQFPLTKLMIAFYFIDNMHTMRRNLFIFLPLNWPDAYTRVCVLYLLPATRHLLVLLFSRALYLCLIPFIFLYSKMSALINLSPLLHHQVFPIKGLFPLTCKHNIIFFNWSKQHIHDDKGMITCHFAMIQVLFPSGTLKLNMLPAHMH